MKSMKYIDTTHKHFKEFRRDYVARILQFSQIHFELGIIHIPKGKEYIYGQIWYFIFSHWNEHSKM